MRKCVPGNRLALPGPLPGAVPAAPGIVRMLRSPHHFCETPFRLRPYSGHSVLPRGDHIREAK